MARREEGNERRRWAALALCAGLLAASPALAGGGELKEETSASIDRQEERLGELARRIWAYAEPALRETRSAADLADYAEERGFTVERGVAGLPTAFVASYGEGRPVIGILGEYDALPGLSQDAVAERRPLAEGAAGHGCGHNLFGPASLGAAVALKELIAAGRLSGTVRFYGTPAEEAVGGKLYMARAGLFDDLDAVLAWHPDTALQADTTSSQAMVDFAVEFTGRAAHAAYDPWNGRSALDGLELFVHGLNLMREHVRPTARIHYTITGGGGVPNVVPEKAEAWVWMRDSTHGSVDALLERARKAAQGAAIATETEVVVRVQSGDWEMLPSLSGARLLDRNLRLLGPVPWTDEDQAFARSLQEAVGAEPVGLSTVIEPLDEHPGPPEGGSTDVADVSWLAPTIHLIAPTAPPGVPWHAWPVVAAGGSGIGHRGMVYAAKALAATMVDLFTDEEALAEVRREFEDKARGVVYRAYIPDGPPPLPAE